MQRSTFAFLPLVLVLGAVAARADAPPTAGPNVQVNQITQGSQLSPDVAQDTAGDFVVVWKDQSEAPVTVRARLFSPTGAPTSDEIVVGTAQLTSSPPRVAMTPLGEFDVVWENDGNIFLRHYDRRGQTANITFDPPPPGVRHNPDVAMDAAGNAYVVWAETHLEGDLILLQRFGRDGFAVGAPEQINEPAPYLRDIARIAIKAAGSLLVAWNDHRGEGGTDVDVWARRFDGPSGTWGPEVRVNPDSTGIQKGNAPILYPEGDGAVVYNDFTARELRVRRFDATGNPTGDPVKLGDLGTAPLYSPAAGNGPDGTSLVAWLQNNPSTLHARFFDRSWQPLGGEFTPSSVLTDSEWDPSVAAGGIGTFAATWSSAGGGVFNPYPELPPVIQDGRDGSQFGVFAQAFQSPACAAGSEVLCLDGGRFQAKVSWRIPSNGQTGTGRAVPLTGDTGSFWFFDSSNLELMVKVLDARALNGHFWVFYGSLSNVEYTLTITDTQLGTVKTYHNPPRRFSSRSDLTSFADPGTGSPASASAALPVAPDAPSTRLAAGSCTPTSTTLCPQNRFVVQVDFIDPRTGTAGQGQAVQLTDDTGVFWFFSPNNLEVMVKVLDGSAANGHFWVFYGGLSDVDYTIRVTDTATGVQKSYHNPRHHLASGSDITTFTAGPTAGR